MLTICIYIVLVSWLFLHKAKYETLTTVFIHLDCHPDIGLNLLIKLYFLWRKTQERKKKNSEKAMKRKSNPQGSQLVLKIRNTSTTKTWVAYSNSHQACV